MTLWGTFISKPCTRYHLVSGFYATEFISYVAVDKEQVKCSAFAQCILEGLQVLPDPHCLSSPPLLHRMCFGTCHNLEVLQEFHMCYLNFVFHNSVEDPYDTDKETEPQLFYHL
jgi:hypothetical protein